LSLGALIDVRTLVNPNILGLAGLLLVVAVAGKVVAGWSGPRGSNRLAVGVGMIPRGEVGLIFASYGLARHVIGADLYSALLLVVSVTTFITPPLAKPLFERIKAPRGRQAGKLVITPRPIRGLTLGPRW